MIYDKEKKYVASSDIAILMATYNGEKFLSKQIDSILAQSVKNWELFIHDDGSTDKTASIINKYVELYPEKIHIVSGEATGNAKSNFFYLMSVVDAKYIMFSDQDDYWLKNKIEVTFNRMKAIENGNIETPVLVFTDLKVVDSELRVISEKLSRYQNLETENTDFNKLMVQNVVTGCTVMVNRSCLIKARTFNHDNIIMHDWWCALVASYFGKISYVNQSLMLYRQHDVNSVGAQNARSLRAIFGKLLNNDLKSSLLKTQKQIKCFKEKYSLDSDYVIYEYSNLSKLPKLRRMKFLIQNKIYKSGFLRNLGLLFYV